MVQVHQKLQLLQEFFKTHGIEYENIDIDYNESTGFSVKAKTDLVEGMVVCKIPKEAVLSIRNTAIANIIEELEFGGILGLSLAILYELSLGEQSPWYQYLSVIPAFEYIPLFWTEKELDYLQNTDVGRALEEDRQYLLDDYNEHIFPALKSGKYKELNADFITLERWMHVASLVSSRAFQVDEYHGECLVPLADLFNHKTDAENVHFENYSDVCDMCGAPDGCGCYQEDDDEEPPELEESAEEEKDLQDTNILEMVVVRPCSTGDEVFNTYGPHSNSSLLRLYGFVDTENPYSTVSISRQEIIEQLKLPAEVLEERVAFWDEAGRSMAEGIDSIESEVDEEGEEHVHGEDCNHDDMDEEGEEHVHGEDCNHDDMDEDMDEEVFDDCCEDENCDGCNGEEESEEVTDDFCFEKDGSPSFLLNAFMNLLLMGDDLYKVMSTDLDTAIKMLIALKDKPESSAKGKSTLTPLQQNINEILKSLAKARLAAYVDDDSEATLAAKYACALKKEEKEILNTFIANC